MFFYITRMYLHHVGELINRKHPEAIEKWLVKNNVNIFQDSTGKYVYQPDFDLANDAILIVHLKSKHGDDWQVAYEAYQANQLYKLLDNKQQTNLSESNNKRYVPKGSIATKHAKNI